MKRAIPFLLMAAAVVPLVGCGGPSDDYDPNKIAVKQPGSGPPPINRPSEPPKNP